ncbi:hypothetical protein ERO13_D10G167133v2 [Gossypium hirsutum]|uniref:Uncharacterized protein n=3 Tax=Gossypium TaxID=3633 RepID=A0A0D2UV12_GOSRA|nr:hypothetical protein ES319_D10G186100v1 [Gossypium barbadense]KAG4126604.1 hypothetical protein ERO13_D10G167133v2 [Gossypium hirsutum]KJB72574.1 hypothetical protein B456_011G186500 [Gossypium raimondii]TYI61674.1 hypothetical protein E1A91_D10G189900v1 [Gossypium mustelinum]
MYASDQLEPDFESPSPIMQPFLHNQNKPAHFHVQTPTSNNNSLLIEDKPAGFEQVIIKIIKCPHNSNQKTFGTNSIDQ